MYNVFKNKREATPYQYVTYLKMFKIGMTMTYEMIKEDSGRVEKNLEQKDKGDIMKTKLS